MADRFGASSLTALLAVAGMVGIGVAGYRAFNASPDAASLTNVADTCPLLGDDCTMTKSEKRGCCGSHGTQGDEEAGCDSHAKTDCKNLADGCVGDGKDGCCGGCAEKAGCCEEKAACAEQGDAGCAEKAACSEKKSCSEKTECAEQGDSGCAEKAACSEKKSCSEKTECAEQGDSGAEKACSEGAKPKTCCSQKQ